MGRSSLLLKLAVVLLTSAATTEAAACRIAILGDSLTAGYGVELTEAFPAVLEAALQRRSVACEVIDAGVSGDTSAGGRARLAWVLSDEPTHLLVELGGNDGLRGLPVDQLEANLAAIIEGARTAGVAVMLAGMFAPPNFGTDYTEAFAAVYGDLADRYSIPLYPFILDGVVSDPALMQPDGIHPNRAGVEEMVQRILPSIEKWLKNSDHDAPS